MRLTVRLEHETELDVIPAAVSELRECQPGVAVAEVVHPIVPDRPGMTDRDSAGVAPNRGGCRTWEVLRQYLVIDLHIQPYESLLLAGQVEVQFHSVGIEFDWRGGVEAESTGVQSVTHAGVVGGIC